MLQRSTIGLLIALGLMSLAHAVQINEIRIDQQGQDNDEYFELVGLPGESLDGVTYLVLGDNTEAVANSSDGIVEMALDLSGHVIPDRGYFLATRGSFSLGLIAPDLIAPLNFENLENVTHLLVRDFTGATGMDLDKDNPPGNQLDPGQDDGVLDTAPWSAVIDAVGVVADRAPSPGEADWFYGQRLGFVDVGPAINDQGDVAPAHIFREQNANTPWVMGTFSTNDAEANDTPGQSNFEFINDLRCDFNASGICDLTDIDLLTGSGDLVAGELAAEVGVHFDLTQDGTVNGNDILSWLALAATSHGLEAPYLLGDVNLDQVVNAIDLNEVGVNWLDDGHVYSSGDINGDGTVNVLDLNSVGVNWLLDNMNPVLPAQSVPETSSHGVAWICFIMVLSLWRRRGRLS